MRYAFVPAMLRIAALLLLLCLPLTARAEPTGFALSGLEPYDAFMENMLKRWDIPGAGLAVARRDKLMLARGYGVANKDKNEPVQATSLFRFASLSKTITSVAVLQLVQEGRLRLDDKVVPILGDIGPRPDMIVDPRVRDITVRHLLQHTGGFNRGRSGDAMFMPRAGQSVERLKAPAPPTCPTILRDNLERKLDFAPGTYYAYSNLGYCILGRVVERVTGTGFEQYVRSHVMGPAGAASMQVGRTFEKAKGEVLYYDHKGADQVRTMPGFPSHFAPAPYSFAMEHQDASGSWIGTPVDYLRFLLAIDGKRGKALLNADHLKEMYARPVVEGAAEDEDSKVDAETFYGMGIHVRVLKNGGMNVWHTGSLPGTNALAVRSSDGYAWVAVFNSRPKDRVLFARELDRGMWSAKSQVKKWPGGDLFAEIK